MAISGFFGKRNIEALSADIEFPEEIYARTSFPLKITLTNNRKLLPAFLVKVHAGGNKLLFPFVEAGKKETMYINLSFSRRGRHRYENIHFCSVFPFNFFTRCKKTDNAYEFIVFPYARKCEYSDILEKGGVHRGEKPLDLTGYEGDIISFRNYITGDPLKYIHWKATARTGHLKTKELSSLSRQPLIIDFDKMPIKNTEEKISCITYIILKLFRHDIPAVLKIKGRVHTIGGGLHSARAGKTGILKDLALYGTE